MKNNKIVKLLVIGGLIIVGVYLFSFFGNNVPQTTLEAGVSNSIPPISSTKESTSAITPLVIGDPNAKVAIVEYADYKCPECGKFHNDVAKRLRSVYVETGMVKIVFRPYPVFSEDGAKALAGSYCAQAQGKFQPYHDKLFAYMWENHFEKGDYQKAIDPVLTDTVMASILQELGIIKSQYDACLEDPATRKAFEDDIDLAAPDEIQGTPSFIIGNQKIVGSQPYSVFKALLDIQLR